MPSIGIIVPKKVSIVGSIVGFGVSTYETIDKGVNWAKDETHWLAGAANDTYCWLKRWVTPLV
jgi:hypothetical protein